MIHSQFLELGSNTTLSRRGGITTCKQAQSKPRGRERDHPDGEREREIGDRDNMVTVSLTAA